MANLPNLRRDTPLETPQFCGPVRGMPKTDLSKLIKKKTT